MQAIQIRDGLSFWDKYCRNVVVDHDSRNLRFFGWLWLRFLFCLMTCPLGIRSKYKQGKDNPSHHDCFGMKQLATIGSLNFTTTQPQEAPRPHQCHDADHNACYWTKNASQPPSMQLCSYSSTILPSECIRYTVLYCSGQRRFAGPRTFLDLYHGIEAPSVASFELCCTARAVSLA